jgi:hypothetical protein
MTAPDIIGDAYGLRDEERARGRHLRLGGSPGPRLRDRTSAVAASGWTIGVIATAITGVLGTAIFAAVSLSGGGVQPEELLPGSSFAFAKVDFDPPAGQKLAVRGLSGRFPDAPAEELTGLRDELVRSLIDDGDVPLDFDKDIAPWLGDRVGLAAFMGSGDEPKAVVALQTSDAEATRRALEKGAADDDVPAVEFRRGYAILAENATDLSEALALVGEETLAENDRYQADRSAIADEQVVVAWADNKVLGEIFMGEVYGDDDGDSGEDTLHDTLEDAFRGRTVLGVHAAPRHVELEVVSLDGAPGAGGATPTTMQRLPDDTVGAVYVHNVARVAEDVGATLGAFGAMGSGFFPFFYPYGGGWSAYDSGGDISVAVEGEEPLPGDDLVDDPPVQCIEPPSDVFADTEPGCAPMPPEVRAEMEQARRRGTAMEQLTTELLPLLQSETTLSLAGVPSDGEDLRFGLTAKVRAPGNAVSPITAFLRAFELDAAAVTTAGELVLAASDKDTLGALKSGGSLGDTDAFTAAMGELGGDTSAAFYLSLDALESVDDYPAELKPLRSVGMVVTETPGRSSMRFRVVVDG